MRKKPGLNAKEAQCARQAAHCVVQTHQRLADYVRAGHTLAQIDTHCAHILKDLNCKSCFRHYRAGNLPPFPSYACLSLNQCVVHGTATYESRPIVDGDILSIDIGVVHQGWIGDAAWTYAIGAVPDGAEPLMTCGKESLRRGIEQMQPGTPYLAWAREVQTVAESEFGFHCVKGLGGHGIGRRLHGPPFVSNVDPSTDPNVYWEEALHLWKPGTLVAVEPMIAIGTGHTRNEPGKWPIYSADDSLSVHYEADVLITETGPENLTAAMCELPDVLA